MSFLSVFTSIAHAAEAAARIAQPIVSAVNPTVGLLLNGAVNAAVGVEASITTPNSGAQKNQIVQATTAATVAEVNAILQSQGKPPLPSNITDATMQSLEMVLSNLNAVQQIVQTSSPAPTYASTGGVTGATQNIQAVPPNPVIVQPS